MNNKRNTKEIQRDTRIEIRVSKEEKDLFYKYAEDLGINPSRLARNILMIEAKKNLIAKGIEKATIKSYLAYLKATNQLEKLDEIKNDG